jgi:hypothetical protein
VLEQAFSCLNIYQKSIVMRVKFKLPLEPFSVNRTYGRDRRHKTQDFRDWELATINALNAKSVQEQLEKIRNEFDPNLHGFLVRFKYMYPANVLFNKEGKISSRAEDLSNIEKPLLDMLFLPKYHVQSFPWGCPNINADDKYVLRMTSIKTTSPDANHYIEISVALTQLVRP